MAWARSLLVWARRSTRNRATALLKAFWHASVAARRAEARISTMVTLPVAVTVVERRAPRRGEENNSPQAAPGRGFGGAVLFPRYPAPPPSGGGEGPPPSPPP